MSKYLIERFKPLAKDYWSDGCNRFDKDDRARNERATACSTICLEEMGKVLEWASKEGWTFWENFPGTSLQAKGPVWIKHNDYSLDPLLTTPDLLSLYIKHLETIK